MQSLIALGRCATTHATYKKPSPNQKLRVYFFFSLATVMMLPVFDDDVAHVALVGISSRHAVDLRQPHQAGHVEDDHGRGRSSAGRANGGVGEVLLASKAIFVGSFHSGDSPIA